MGFAHLDEHNSPFWPQVNTCVYKEVWIKPPIHWLWLAADLYGSVRVWGQAAEKGGEISFTEEGTGTVYTLHSCKNTGWYEGELPAGRYCIRHAGRCKHTTLLVGGEYRLDAPFNDYLVTGEKTGD